MGTPLILQAAPQTMLSDGGQYCLHIFWQHMITPANKRPRLRSS